MANRYLNLINSEYTPKLKPYMDLKFTDKNISDRFDLEKEYIVFCPDAEFGPAKKWPTKKWLDLANLVKGNYQVVFVGVDTSIKLLSENTQSGNYRNLIGRTSLEEATIILSQAICVVSNDSGLMHVAAALDRPIVGIYGSSSPEYTPPLTQSDKRVIIYQNMSCSPCFKKVCPLKHLKCLEDISVDSVRQSITRLIQ